MVNTITYLMQSNNLSINPTRSLDMCHLEILYSLKNVHKIHFEHSD